jgi:GxxExxY protein
MDADQLNQLTGRIIGAAVRVHRTLGPGLLESAYEACLAYELGHDGLEVERQIGLPLTYGEVRLDCGYRLDLLVEDAVVVEVKAVEELLPLHEVQLLTYLRLSGRHVGLVLNFNVGKLTDGVRRVVDGFPE